jgi:hypothetical protein
VLATLDESSYKGGKNGRLNHPFAWNAILKAVELFILPEGMQMKLFRA